MIIVLIVIMGLTGIAYAYTTNMNWTAWYPLPTFSANPFWTNSSNPQNCNWMDNGSSCSTKTWTVIAPGTRGVYQMMVNFTSDNSNVSWRNTSYVNVTIYEKGDNGVILRENTSGNCPGCAFTVASNDTNPVTCSSNLQANQSCNNSWIVTARGPLSSVWAVYANYTANSTFISIGYNNTTSTKVRIVDYTWWQNGTYDANKTWNCRQSINITQNTGTAGSGIIQINSFHTADPVSETLCRPINCTRELRVTEVLSNGTQQYIPFLNVSNEITHTTSSFTWCEYADIKFNTTLQANQTKQFFVYSNAPLKEIDYLSLNPNDNVTANWSYGSLNTSSRASVWGQFFDSHIDFWWMNQSDDIYNMGSTVFRTEANWSFYNLTEINYKPQVQVDRNESDFANAITNDLTYFFVGHGALYNSTNNNQTAFNINALNYVYADNVTNLAYNLPAKLVYVAASFSGDNNTTLTGCPLNNWLSKAFVTDRAAKCYLGFLHRASQTLSCSSCSCATAGSDLHIDDVQNFNACFWNDISLGRTVWNATTDCDKNTSTCGGGFSSCVNPVLVNSTVGGCNSTLTK